MYNKTVQERLLEAKDEVVAVVTLRWIEILATVLFLIAMAGGRRRWLNFIHIFGFIDAFMCLVAPDTYLSLYFEGKPDQAHMTLLQMTCLLMLCWILCYWLLIKSTDSTTETSFLLSYTVMTLCIFVAAAYTMTHPSKNPGLKMSEGMKVPMFYVDLLVVVGSLYFYLSAKDWGGYGEIMSHANFHLRLEFVMLMFMGVMMYSLPQWIVRLMTDVEKLDSMHGFLARCIGSILIAMSLMSGRAANFLREDSKDSVVLSHLVFYLMMVVTSCCSVYRGWAGLSWKQVGLQTLHHSIIVFNAAGALNLDPTVFTRILLPRIKAIPRDVKSCLKWKTH